MKCTLMRLESVREEDFDSVSLLTDAHCHQMGTCVVTREAGLGTRIEAVGQFGW